MDPSLSEGTSFVDRIASYPKVWNLGHPHIAELLLDPVVVEEKVDGSQFSFCMLDGQLLFRSKSAIVLPEVAGMFAKGVAAVQEIAGDLQEGWVYRGEFLQKPKHNALAYSRVPARNIVLFDVQTGVETYLDWDAKADEAARLGFETVPYLGVWNALGLDDIRVLLQRESFLGGQPIEGVVVKNYTRFGRDGKALMGKFVSEAFKEQHRRDWKITNPGHRDVIETVGASLRSERRWEKAVEFLRDAGLLDQSPRDIGPLMRRVHEDVETECAEEIKEVLYKWAIPMLRRKVTGGLPEWYKERLLEQQFTSNKEKE